MTNESHAAHAERKHCTFGGSSAARWVNCGASVVYLQNMPPEVPSEHAEEGTKAHELAEMLLHDWLEHKRNGTDPEIRAHLSFGNVDDEMKDAVYAYRDAIWEKVLRHSITQKAYGFEEMFMLSEELDIGGPCDFWCVGLDDRGKRYGYVVDFKYGYVEVEAKDNLQLAVYACGLRNEIRKLGKDLDYVHAAIYQPRGGGVAFKPTLFTSSQLDRYEKKFLKAAKSILLSGEKAPRAKVGDWCKHCRAQAMCPPYQKAVDEKMAVTLVDAERDIKLLPSPETIPDEKLLEIILADDMITGFLKSCRSYALSRAHAGKPIAGLKVVHTSARRKWLDTPGLIAETLRNSGLNDVLQEPKLKAITDIEKQLKKLHGAKQADSILEPLLTLSRPTEFLVPETDPRKAIVSFDDLLDAAIET